MINENQCLYAKSKKQKKKKNDEEKKCHHTFTITIRINISEDNKKN